MEQKSYLIDTNAVIDFLANNFPKKGILFMRDIVNSNPSISIIAKIEVLGFDAPDPYNRLLEDFILANNQLQLTEEVVNATIELRKKHKIKLPDAIIAATAIVHKMILITRNVKDFKKISRLDILDPHTF